jgi:hypothetical protein
MQRRQARLLGCVTQPVGHGFGAESPTGCLPERAPGGYVPRRNGMRGGFLSLLGIGFFLLALWRAVRVRRDLASGQTRWETALFGRAEPICYQDTPVRFWCAILVHTTIVLLFALVGAAAFRATALAKL